MKTKVNLVTNLNRETRKTRIRTRHVQNKNPKGFNYKNETRTYTTIKVGCNLIA
jgi:hypothetical protein